MEVKVANVRWSDQVMTVEELMEAMNITIEKKKKSIKKKISMAKEYEFQKSMMFAIQAITNHQTHEIMTTLVDETNKLLEESDIDLTISPKDNHPMNNYSTEKRLKKYLFYPGTELYIGCYVLYTDYAPPRGYDCKLKYNFKLPIASLKLDEKEFDEYITDGILCDASKDIDKPELKSSLSKEEREIKELQRLQKQREYAAKRKANKLKK